VVIALGSATGTGSGTFAPSAPLQAAWTTAIDDVLARERAIRLSERLAEANREIMIHRETVAQARASAAVGAIAAGAAHEINNPLAIITGRSHLLGRHLVDTELSDATAEIQKAAAKVASLVDALSQAVAPIEIDRSRTDVARLIAEASATTDPLLSGAVTLRCAGDMSPVNIDAGHIRSVIRELLDNALRMGEGERITIDARQSGEVLRIQVVDSGPGFSEKALEHAFQPFFSDHAAGRRSGLGLANARRLVEAHGGSISVRNRPLCPGAEVSVYLPLDAHPDFTDGISLSETRGVA